MTQLLAASKSACVIYFHSIYNHLAFLFICFVCQFVNLLVFCGSDWNRFSM